jgi:hypothetical protein
MKSNSNELYNTLTLAFIVLTILVFLCSVGMLSRVLPVPGFLQVRTPIIPTQDVLPTVTPTNTPSPTFTPSPEPSETPTLPPTRTPRPTLTLRPTSTP